MNKYNIFFFKKIKLIKYYNQIIMSLTIEEIQKSLTNSMMSMQAQMDTERQNYKKKIQDLEDKNLSQKEKIDELTETLASKKMKMKQ